MNTDQRFRKAVLPVIEEHLQRDQPFVFLTSMTGQRTIEVHSASQDEIVQMLVDLIEHNPLWDELIKRARQHAFQGEGL